jgi:predicted  nucleic acid-binding Zn-ribbon protein
MRDEVEKLRNEIRLLRVDLENKRNEIEDMGKSIQKTENSEYQIQSLKKELELAQRTNSDFQIEIEALRKKVDDAQSEIIQFTKQQQEANELLNKSQLVAQNEERLRTIIEQNDKEIKKLTNELQELKTGNILGLNPAGREEMKVRVRELIAKINSHL